jgi:hypothetical protein
MGKMQAMPITVVAKYEVRFQLAWDIRAWHRSCLPDAYRNSKLVLIASVNIRF